MPNRTQISTGCSEETRRQVDELVTKCGYSLREAITLAVDALYRAKIADCEEMQQRLQSTGKPTE